MGADQKQPLDVSQLARDTVAKYPWSKIDKPRVFAGGVYLIALVFTVSAYAVKGHYNMAAGEFPTSSHWLLVVIPVLYAVTAWLTVDMTAYGIQKIRHALRS